ncbi:hypothetical protein HID58_092336 [Brassica napus]|uniref:Uncharacterized protein n=1 Tax=Brassica napus TaxID=3708 RepID=A0ABQ7WWW1_BRANA|nr:hypothetical protein HID58_092336 [Brassica napus]
MVIRAEGKLMGSRRLQEPEVLLRGEVRMEPVRERQCLGDQRVHHLYSQRVNVLQRQHLREERQGDCHTAKTSYSNSSEWREERRRGERSYKDVKKEEETCESMEELRLKKLQRRLTKHPRRRRRRKSKKVVTHVEVGESSRGRKKKAEKLKTLKKKKIKTVKKGVPEFEITIRKSYLKFCIPGESMELHDPSLGDEVFVECALLGEGESDQSSQVDGVD